MQLFSIFGFEKQFIIKFILLAFCMKNIMNKNLNQSLKIWHSFSVILGFQSVEFFVILPNKIHSRLETENALEPKTVCVWAVVDLWWNQRGGSELYFYNILLNLLEFRKFKCGWSKPRRGWTPNKSSTACEVRQNTCLIEVCVSNFNVEIEEGYDINL